MEERKDGQKIKVSDNEFKVFPLPAFCALTETVGILLMTPDSVSCLAYHDRGYQPHKYKAVTVFTWLGSKKTNKQKPT